MFIPSTFTIFYIGKGIFQVSGLTPTKLTKKELKAEREANEIRMIFQLMQSGKSIGDIASEMGLSSAIVMSYCKKYKIDATGYRLPAEAKVREFDTLNGAYTDELPTSGNNDESITTATDKEMGPKNIEKELSKISESGAIRNFEESMESTVIAKIVDAGNADNEIIMDSNMVHDIAHCDNDGGEQESEELYQEELRDQDFDPLDAGSINGPEFDESFDKELESELKEDWEDISKESDNNDPKRFYLVDTENQGCAALKKILKAPDIARRFLLFYTNYSQHLDFQTVRLIAEQASSMEFIECRYGIKNALDFQLISYLGYLIHQYPEAAFTIVSNDGGFDPAILFWKDRHVKISRLGVKCTVNPPQVRSGQYYNNYRYNNQGHNRNNNGSGYYNPGYGPQRMDSWYSSAAYHENVANVPERSEVNSKKPNPPAPKKTLSSMSDSPVLEETTDLLNPAQRIAEVSITARREDSYVQLRKVGSCYTKYTPKQYRRVTQIAASELGGLFKKHKIKSNKIARIAEYIVCHPDFTKSEILQLSDYNTADALINNVSQAEIKTLLIRAERRK